MPYLLLLLPLSAKALFFVFILRAPFASFILRSACFGVLVGSSSATVDVKEREEPGTECFISVKGEKVKVSKKVVVS